MTRADRVARPNLTSSRRARAVVIGSGFGGLAAAVRLGARGFDVTVLERLDQPGGRASVHRQDGFVFDAGPTIITAPFLLEELWALAGRRLSDDVDLRPVSPFYRLRFSDGTSFDASGDPAAMRAEIARISADDLEGYESFLAFSEENFRIGFERYADAPFSSLADMVRATPDLVRLRSHRSVYAAVCDHVRDERLRQALSFHPLFVGGNPFRVPALFVLIQHLERRWGVHFAMGGTGALVAGLVRLIERQGGELRTGAEADEIVVERGRATGVRLATGELTPANIVVSNADAAWTYRHLLRRTPRWFAHRSARMRQSMSLFVWYFGTRRTYPDTPHHTILLGPRYQGLIADIFDRKQLAPDFSLYLHRPTATDPSLAPPGCDAFYVLSPVPNLDADVDWTVEAEPYRRRIARHLEATLLPGLEAALATSRVTTPLDFRDRYLAERGAAFGPEPILLQSAWFRPHNASELVENLFMVGAGTHPGAGVPGVLSSARILDKVVPDAATFV
jgi:phytoene desaturase